MISQVRVAAALCYRAATPDSFSVLGIPHPAVDTRDAALYMVSLVLSPTTRKQGTNVQYVVPAVPQWPEGTANGWAAHSYVEPDGSRDTTGWKSHTPRAYFEWSS